MTRNISLKPQSECPVRPRLTRRSCLRRLASAAGCFLTVRQRRTADADTAVEAAAFRFEEADTGAVGLWQGDRPVLVYNYGMRGKDGVPEDRQRSSYVHPLYDLDGEVLSDDFPDDHLHHRGLFWAWPHVRVGQKEYDLWALRGIRHQFQRFLRRHADCSRAVLEVENGWYVGERRCMREQIRFDVHPATAEHRAIDVELRLTPTTEAVTLRGAEGKGYGGLTLRFAPRRDTVITTAGGRQPKDLNLTRLAFADLSANFHTAPGAADSTGPVSGATMFVHPEHPGFPPQWITRHYGVLGVGWPGEKPKTLPPGRTVTCRYRLWIHRGRPTPEGLQKAFKAYQAMG